MHLPTAMNRQPSPRNDGAPNLDDQPSLAPFPTTNRADVLDSSDGLVDYFAIGAMMNPISVANRSLKPVASEPAELLDYRLGFFTTQGYGEAVRSPGSSFHGVIHHLTPTDMVILDSIESEYDRVTATARLYDGTKRQVTVYVRSEKHVVCECAPPSERYLEIMIAGAEHYGVHPSHIDFLRNHERVQRPCPEEFISFGNVEANAAVITMEEVKENNGCNGKPLYMAVNSKVVEAALDRNSKEFIGLCKFLSHVGQICELFVPKVVYDPKYGMPSRLQDVTPEHAAYCEHSFCMYLKIQGTLDQWKVIGHLEGTSVDGTTRSTSPSATKQVTGALEPNIHSR